MSEIACRDCGHVMDSNERGCPRCALNLEAEKVFDRVVMGIAATAFVFVLAVGFYWFVG